MAISTTSYHAGSHNKAKDRRGAHHFKIGKYRNRPPITERNRILKIAKHLRNHPNDHTVAGKLP